MKTFHTCGGGYTVGNNSNQPPRWLAKLVRDIADLDRRLGGSGRVAVNAAEAAPEGPPPCVSAPPERRQALTANDGDADDGGDSMAGPPSCIG